MSIARPSMQGRWRYLLALPLLVVAIFSFAFVRGNSGGGESLLAQQRQAQALTNQAVARVVRVAPDPVSKRPGVSAGCASIGQGALRNPWTCTIRYTSGRIISYRVNINADGSYNGGDESVRFHGQRFRDTGTISGCCITIP